MNKERDIRPWQIAQTTAVHLSGPYGCPRADA